MFVEAKTNVASGLCLRVASSRLSVPFALIVKSVCGSDAAQSRRLRGGVHDELETRRVLGEERRDGVRVAYLHLERPEGAGVGVEQPLRLGPGRGLRAEEVGAHVVLDPDHLEAGFHEIRDGLRADEAPGSGYDGARHDGRDAISFPIRSRRQNGALVPESKRFVRSG